MIVARRIRGLGAVTGSADIPQVSYGRTFLQSPQSLVAGSTLHLPQNSSLTTLQQHTASYSPVQLFSAMQRYQTQLAANQTPTQQVAADAAGQMNVPAVNDPVQDVPSAPIQLPDGSVVTATTSTDASGKLAIPPAPPVAKYPSKFSQIMWTWGPPVVAVGGLTAAIFFLTRKRKGS